MNTAARPGDWVEISAVLLSPAERAPNLPAETAAVPLVMRVRGWAEAAAEVGAEVAVRTQAGRVLRGTLLVVNPRFDHGFGGCVPELIEVRRRLKAEMAGNAGSSISGDGGTRNEEMRSVSSCDRSSGPCDKRTGKGSTELHPLRPSAAGDEVVPPPPKIIEEPRTQDNAP